MRTYKRVLDPDGTYDYSPWVRMNNATEDYSAGFRFTPSSGASGTYSIQNTLSNPEDFQRATFSRSTTTLTITLVDHGLSAGDGVNLRGSDWDQTGGYSLNVASAADADTITVTVADSGAAAGSCEVAPLRIEDFTDFSAVSGVQQGSTSGGVQMIRAAVAGGSYASGKGVLEVTQSGI